MPYVAYLPNTEKFKFHFSALGKSKPQKDFYIVRKSQSGNGISPIVTVSPTEQNVNRAKSEIDHEREANIREIIPALDHLATKRRGGNTSKKKASGVKKRKT